MEMCRFSGPRDVEYKKVAASLQRMTANLPKGGVFTPTPSTSFTSEQRQQLRDSLKFDQIDSRQMDIKKAHAKTCKWLGKTDKYIDWLSPSKFSDHHGFLWIKGNPGTGKSTLMKFALAEAMKSMTGWTVLSFFFHARGGELEKTTAGMYRSLLLQLLERIPKLDSVFDLLRLTTWPRDGQVHWSVESLKDLFQQAVQSLGPTQVVCFIDALDECDEDQIRDMLSFFEHMGELAMASNFRVCFSSRYYPHITISRGLELVLEGQEGHDQDIANYIDSKLQIGHSKVAEEIRAKVQAKASSVFMWVVLVVDILKKEYDRGRIHTLRKRLREIPDDLHDLFRDMLTRDARDREELILCIQWVLFAKTPLRPEELYFAVLAGTDPEAPASWDQELTTLAVIRRFILDSSKGLAETTKSKTPVVQFIHESVRDFLLKDNGLQKIWPDLGDRFNGKSHERLKNCCLKYASDIAGTPHFPEPLPKDPTELRDRTQQSHPFLKYAVRCVLYHADKAELGGVGQGSFLSGFPLQRWIGQDNFFERYEKRRLGGEASFFYVLAERNLPSLIKAHFATSDPLEASKERYQRPFLAALATESTDAFLALAELLLHQATSPAVFRELCQSYVGNPNRIPKLGREFCPSKDQSWVKLATDGNAEFVLILLATCKVNLVKFNRSYHDDWSPLSWAAENGRTEIVELLLDLDTDRVGSDANSIASTGQMLLSEAAEKGNEAVVKLILDTGKVNPNTRSVLDSRTLIMRAAWNGHTEVVKLLLGTGKVDLHAKDDEGFTALSLAARSGAEAIVELLLATGKVDLDVEDTYEYTPLCLATTCGHTAVVKLLLDTGNVNTNHRSPNGATPLWWAAKLGHKAIVKLLLDTGKVDKNHEDNSGATPMSLAVENGDDAVVELLEATR